MKRVFISHPFANNPYLNSERVDTICKSLINHHDDILPISPLHSFSYFDKDKPEYRKYIMEMCFDLIEKCDVVWVYIYKALSKGQKRELEHVLEYNRRHQQNDKIKIKLIEV